MRSIIWLILAAVLGACQVLGGSNMEATLQTSSDQYRAEAVGIVATAEYESTSMSATVQSSQATATYFSAGNIQYEATLRVLNTPTIQIVAAGNNSSAPQLESTAAAALASGQRWFIKTGVVAGVNEANGCAEGLEGTFPSSTPVLYATVTAYNIKAGTPMRADWYYNGELVYSGDWSVGQSASQLCLFYFITPDDVPFTPGLWSVALFADGFQLESPMSFNIVDEMGEN